MIKKILQTPLNTFTTLKGRFLSSVIFGFYGFLFFVITKPFESKPFVDEVIYLVAGFGTVVVLGNFLTHALINQFYSKIYENWNVGKEIIQFIATVLLLSLYCSIFNYFFTPLKYKNFISFKYLVIAYTYIGFIPVLLYCLFFEIKKQKAMMLFNNELKTIKNKKVPKEGSSFSIREEKVVVKIKSQLLKEGEFLLNQSNLIFIKSDDNYCRVYFIEDLNIKERLIRVTLKDVENQLNDNKKIVRCHRSYLINIDNVKSIEGNSKKRYVSFVNSKHKVPVSNSFDLSRFNM